MATKRTTRTTRKRPASKPKTRTAEAQNLDTAFWMLLGGKNGISVQDVLTKPYLYHVWVYSCVSTIVSNIAPLKRKLRDTTGKIIDDHEILRVLKRPNTLMTEQQFWRAILSYILLPAETDVKRGGQCFIIPWNVKRDMKVDLRREIPGELYVYPDNYFEPRTKKISGNRQEFLGWSFGKNITSENAIEFSPYEIIRVNIQNPYDLLKGMSPVMPIAQALELDIHADIYNQNIFENDGRLAGQVHTDQFIRDDDLEKIKKEWGKQYTGSRRNMVAFLTGGMKYEQFALSQTDMQYMEQSKWLRQKVIAAYRLNRIALGDYEEINFATIREGRKMLWQDTYIPTDQIILDSINNQWINYIENDKYDLITDYSRVPALQSDISERIKTGGTLCQQYAFPPELAARLMEIPLTQEDLTRWPHLSEPIKSPTAGPMLFNAPDTVVKDTPVTVVRDAREEYSKDYILRILDPHERAFRRDLDRYFITQRNEMQDRVDEWMKEKDKSDSSGYLFMPDPTLENAKLVKIYRPNVNAQAQAEVDQVERELAGKKSFRFRVGGGISLEVSDARIDYWISQRLAYLDEINWNTFTVARDAIDMTIMQSMEEGVTPSEMAKRVKQAIRDVYEVRLGKPIVPHGDFDLGGMSSSLTIARTEMGTVASLARFDAYREEKIEKTEWITSADDRVRELHMALDGQTAILGDTFEFSSGGDSGMKFPRDSVGGPGMVINCVLPDTLVSGSFIGALKSFYSGYAFEITTRHGNRIRVTENHPIATERGFVSAANLCEGDYVVCYRGDIDAPAISFDNYKKHGVSRADDIFDTILSHGTSWIHSPSALDLDGDGEFLAGHVDIVKWLGYRSVRGCISDSGLVLKDISSSFEFGNNGGFISSDTSDKLSFVPGDFSSFVTSDGVRAVSSGNPRARALSDNSVGVLADSAPFNYLRVGAASDFNVSRYKYPTYGSSGYSIFLRDLFLAHPGDVILDDIVNIRRFKYDGHVYDLQSDVGYFNSNNIISRNCRCVAVAKFD